MAEGSSNPEIDLGLGKVSEVSQEQIEQFQEQLAQAQAALAQLQKDEGRAKKKDMALAGLLSRFVKTNQDQDILKLIVDCLNRGIPVNFIVATLSLGFEDIHHEMSEELKRESSKRMGKQQQEFLTEVSKEENRDLETKRVFDEQHLPENVKQRINEWVKDILLLSLESKKKMLSTTYENGKPHITPLQLTSKMLEKYLSSVNIEGAFDRMRAFSTFILLGIGKELQKEK